MGHGAIPAEVDATIVFIRERSPADRCASESLVADAIADRRPLGCNQSDRPRPVDQTRSRRAVAALGWIVGGPIHKRYEQS